MRSWRTSPLPRGKRVQHDSTRAGTIAPAAWEPRRKSRGNASSDPSASHVHRKKYRQLATVRRRCVPRAAAFQRLDLRALAGVRARGTARHRHRRCGMGRTRRQGPLPRPCARRHARPLVRLVGRLARLVGRLRILGHAGQARDRVEPAGHRRVLRRAPDTRRVAHADRRRVGSVRRRCDARAWRCSHDRGMGRGALAFRGRALRHARRPDRAPAAHAAGARTGGVWQSRCAMSCSAWRCWHCSLPAPA